MNRNNIRGIRLKKKAYNDNDEECNYKTKAKRINKESENYEAYAPKMLSKANYNDDDEDMLCQDEDKDDEGDREENFRRGSSNKSKCKRSIKDKDCKKKNEK